jgi:hypothetical protein
MDHVMETVLSKVIEQGFSVFVLAIALWYLHVKLTKVENKITECEQDRLKLWERIAQLHD